MRHEVTVPEGNNNFSVLSVPIKNDAGWELEEWFTVTATNLSGVWLPPDSDVVVRIVDDDTVPTGGNGWVHRRPAGN
ncbi:MAG: hypothetical protein NVV60_14915 [Luteimonas sp.]|nr:hypothetical protein [Luteimonas sp.]